MPSVYFSDDPKADLESYAGTYLQQEVVAEGATRNVPAFSRFLRVAALANATLVNFTNIANDAQVPHDLRSLRAIGEERTFERLLCVSLEPRRRQVDNITILPYGQFLDRLWEGEFK